MSTVCTDQLAGALVGDGWGLVWLNAVRARVRKTPTKNAARDFVELFMVSWS